jgi:hypothetical protein
LVLDPGAASEKKRDFESGIYPAYAVRDAIDVKNPIGTDMQTRKKGGKEQTFYPVGYVFFFLSGSGFTGLECGS